jgi:deazaflavin-dependent oxidoreductase (nitroreductase family)
MIEQPPNSQQWQVINRYIVDEFRNSGGSVKGQFEVSEILLLTTTGAKSGEHRLVPLSCFTIDDKLTVVGSNVGADFHPGWVHNLRADPRAHAELGYASFDVIARELPLAEREDTFAKVVVAAPRFADYQANTSRLIPLFELQRGS